MGRDKVFKTVFHVCPVLLAVAVLPRENGNADEDVSDHRNKQGEYRHRH